MTTTSQLGPVIDYLVARAKTWPTLGGAVPPVSVFDGPQVPVVTQSLPQVLWFGCDPPNPDAVIGDAVQAWPVLDKGRTRDEDGTVTCAAQDWSGDPSAKVHRDGAMRLLAGVELMLRGDGTTGPGDMTMGGLVFWSAIDTYQIAPRQIAGGYAALVTFTITYRARLTTTGA